MAGFKSAPREGYPAGAPCSMLAERLCARLAQYDAGGIAFAWNFQSVPKRRDGCSSSRCAMRAKGVMNRFGDLNA